jgi:hypothetical protein
LDKLRRRGGRGRKERGWGGENENLRSGEKVEGSSLRSSDKGCNIRTAMEIVTLEFSAPCMSCLTKQNVIIVGRMGWKLGFVHIVIKLETEDSLSRWLTKAANALKILMNLLNRNCGNYR